MSKKAALELLSIFKDLSFECYEIDSYNYKLVLSKNNENHSLLFCELQKVCSVLIKRDLDFCVEADGTIVIE